MNEYVDSSVLSDSESQRTSSRSSSFTNTISVQVETYWTNATVEDYICGRNESDISTITVINMQVPFNSPNWYRLPSCIASWPRLATISCSYCQMPNFTALPPSVTSVALMYSKGSWTQSDAGVVDDAAHANYFDWSWLSRMPIFNTLSSLNNPISGTLPNHLNHSTIATLTVSTLGTQLVGTISPDFFRRFPALSTLILTGHQLTGTIPYYGLESLVTLSLTNNSFTHWPTLIVNSTVGFRSPSLLQSVQISQNNLVEIPSQSSFRLFSSLKTLTMANNPGLSGTFPNPFETTTLRTAGTLLFQIVANGCAFRGPLPEIPAYQVALYNEATGINQLYLYDNFFTGTIPTSWSTMTINSILLQNNTGLTGALATLNSEGQIISQFVKSSSLLLLKGRGFTGPMFNISTMPTLSSLTLQAPNMDFCSQARNHVGDQSTPLFPRPGMASCDLTNSNASMCAWAYPAICRTSALEPWVEEPVSGCPLPSPGPTFVCINNMWVAYGSVTEETISFPGSSTTIVNGNLTVSSIVVTSSSSSVNVTGCITPTDGTLTVTLILTQADLEAIIKQGGSLTSFLIQQASACHTTFDLVVDTSAIHSCKTIKTNRLSTASTMAATFTVSTSKCNVWWIVLVSVLCGVVLLALIVLIVLVSVSKRVRYIILPFSRKRDGQLL